MQPLPIMRRSGPATITAKAEEEVARHFAMCLRCSIKRGPHSRSNERGELGGALEHEHIPAHREALEASCEQLVACAVEARHRRRPVRLEVEEQAGYVAGVMHLHPACVVEIRRVVALEHPPWDLGDRV